MHGGSKGITFGKKTFQTLIGQAPNQREIFKVTRSLLNTKADRALPSSESDKELADQFATLFYHKDPDN